MQSFAQWRWRRRNVCCANKKTNFFTLFLLLSLFYPTHPFPPFYVCPHELAWFLLFANIHGNYQLFSSLVFNSHTRILYDLSCSPQKKQPSIIEKTIIRYHNREAVVISALQVEKNPLATPGPYTPPVQRSFHSTAMALAAFTPPSSSMLSRKSVHHLHGDHLTIASSCHGSPMRPQSTASYYTTATTALFESPRYGESMLLRNSPKPHSSPKMKLRLIKANIFIWWWRWDFFT